MLRSLGIQTSSSSSTYLGGASTRFIPTPQIQDIFIHEAFRGFEVRHYLAIVVEGEGELTVVFPVCPFSIAPQRYHGTSFSRAMDLWLGGLTKIACTNANACWLQKLLPRLVILEEVWRGARACLFDREAKGDAKIEQER